MKKLSIILFFSALVLSACGSGSNSENANLSETKPANNQNASAEKSGASAGSNQTDKKESSENVSQKNDCFNVKAAGKKVVKK